MNYRVRNIGIAVGLAALAAILTSVYVVNYKRHVQNGEDKVTVLVAARDIPAGTAGADVVDQKFLKEQTVARKAVVAGAISSPDQLAQYVATQDVFEGEQVSTRRFAPPAEQGVRSQIKGTQRAYELAGDPNQLLAGTLKEGDHIDVVGNWTVKVQGGSGDDHHITRVVLRNILVMRAPIGVGTGSTVTSGGDKSQNVQLRVTDVQVQKLFWIEKNGDWHQTLRPPVNSVDSGNTIQEVDTMFFDGPGRRP